MARDDMYVVMFKIIAYLYSCMKKGEEPQDAKWGAQALGIPEPYWAQIVEELASHGLIAGVNVAYADDEPIVLPVSPRVTMEGVAFFEENTMIAKARKFLQETKSSVPFV